MKNNKIFESVELNEKGKKTALILVLAASLFAMAAALFGFLFGRKNGKAESEKRIKTRRSSARSESASKRKHAQTVSKRSKTADGKQDAASPVVQQSVAQPQTVYVVRPLPEQKKESKGRRFKRHMSAAVAVILVVSLVGSGTMDYITPATVQAKGSFSGIGRVVDNHIQNDSPYVILDIVPAVAKYGDYSFSTGTMGYLVSGEAPIVKDLQKYLIDNSRYYSYDDRQALLNAVTVGNSSVFPDVTYREAYGNIGGLYDVSEATGWIRMFDAVDGAGEEDNVPTGVIKGTAIYSKDGTAEDGYVFKLVEDNGKWSTHMNSLGDYFKLNSQNGSTHVLFAQSADGSYVIDGIYSLSEIGPSAASTWVYRYNEVTGAYEYQNCTIWDLIQGAMSGENEDGHVANIDSWEHDDDYHWHLCAVDGCEEHVFDKYSHELEWKFDESSQMHWQECECGYTTNGSLDHIYTEEDSTTCAVCGATILEGDAGEAEDSEKICEEHQFGTWGHDDNSHWKVCSVCNEAYDVTGHDSTCGQCYEVNEPETTEPAGPKPPEGGNTNHGDDTTEGGNTTGGGNTTEGEDATGGGNTTEDGNAGQGGDSGQDGNASQGGDSGQDDDATQNGDLPEVDPEEIIMPAEPDSDSDTSAKSIPIPGRWLKLVEPGDELQGEGDFNADSNNNDGINWDSIDWSMLEEQGYCVVTFRALTSDDVIDEGITLYDSAYEETLSSAGDVFDAYDFVEAEEERGFSAIALMQSFPILGAGDSADTVDGVFQYAPGDPEAYWKLERVADGSESTDEIGTIEVKNVPVYFRCSSNNDWLKQYVFGTLSDGDNANSDFKIHVNTVLANEVTPDMIEGADLVYLEGGQGNTVLGNLELEYFTQSVEGEQDMSGDVVAAILRRATVDLMPVIVDYDITQSANYPGTNYQLLAKAMLKRDLAEFYAAVSSYDSGALMSNISSGINDVANYPDKTDNNYNYVNQNVYMVNQTLVSSDFADAFEENFADAGFSDVMAAIKAENTMLSDEDKLNETVSKSRAIQYVINYSEGIIGEIGDLKILELQPTNNNTSDLHVEYSDKGDYTYAKLCWKNDSTATAKQILSSKTTFSIDQDIKSVAEFNGEWEDINGTYDIVFIGLDGQRLNRDDDREHTALYNKAALNGKVYHQGDDAGGGNRYDANDITGQKMQDLLSYMEAGYPVLVENNCFREGTAQKAGDGDVNDKYIDSDSVMYRFLNTAVTDDRYRDYIFTVSDAMASPLFMTQVRISKPRINVVSADNAEVAGDKVQPLSTDENGEYHGTIAYQVTDNKGDAYYGDTVIHLYADFNYDGIFAEEEEVTEYSNDGGKIEVVVSDMGPGILPWKLEVTDAGNSNRRDSEQGYFELRSSTVNELKVLQITEQTDDDRISLQRMYNTKEDSLLGSYLRGAEVSTNTKYIFETVNAAQLKAELDENAKYLEQWDVVVMTLDGGVGLPEVTAAVTSYAEAGRSLLVCGQGLEGQPNSGEDRLGLSAGLLGQSESLTYSVLAAAYPTENYLRYDGLKGYEVGGHPSLLGEMINDGSISYYPYQLGNSSITFGQRGLLRAPTYLLDFDNNLHSESNATYVTAWYTFGTTAAESQYVVSPKDARNNYYCYSKGNVVYLAQSEYPNTINNEGEGEGECKLFVNALMAAYSAGVHNSNVHIVAGFAADSADVESIAVPFDQDWLDAASEDGSTGMLDNTVDVYFRFRDSNMAMNKTVEIEFLREDPNGPELDIGGRTVNAETFSSEIWAVTDGRLTLVARDQLVPGQIYRIKAPVVTLENDPDNNKADIYIVIRSTFMRGGRECHVTSSDVVSLNRAQLFLLE